MTAANGKQRTFLGHPLGLYILFFTEMWERFSYYGMRALLMLYMVNYFKWSQKDASTTYKIYTSFVYITPILGGYLADRFLGNKIAVIIGALLMAVGHFLMAFEEYPIFLSALIFLIVGNGFFKPNMSTQVGRLYPANDGRLDGAYTIFYMGINLGAFLSPVACGWLAENTVGGFHSGFTLAGIGMVAGLVIYLLGQPLVKELPHGQQAADTTAAPVNPQDDGARAFGSGSGQGAIRVGSTGVAGPVAAIDHGSARHRRRRFPVFHRGTDNLGRHYPGYRRGLPGPPGYRVPGSQGWRPRSRSGHSDTRHLRRVLLGGL